MNPIKKTFTYGAHQVTLETGEIARQAGGAVMVNMDDTVVLCTGQDPLRTLAAQLEARGRTARLIGGAREAGELDARRAMREGAELAAEI